MGGLNPFAKPKIPNIKPTPAPAVPTRSDAEVKAAESDLLDRLRKQRGRAGTILAGDDGLMSGGGMATKTLLGGGY